LRIVCAGDDVLTAGTDANTVDGGADDDRLILCSGAGVNGTSKELPVS
jgi:hypothetical protein